MPIYHEQWKQAGMHLLIIRLHSKEQPVLERLAQKPLRENRDSKVRVLRLQSMF